MLNANVAKQSQRQRLLPFFVIRCRLAPGVWTWQALSVPLLCAWRELLPLAVIL